jgi:tripartite-type tricarboxylate transporter receptor subunit TctC
VAYVKKHPGELNYGSAGNASAGHLAMEYLKLVTGHVHHPHPLPRHRPAAHRPAGRAHPGLIGRAAGAGRAHQAGKLRAIAVGTQQRICRLPDVPTVAEMGFKDFETSQWYGILVPAGTPRDIVKRLQEESLKALKSS